MTNEVLATLIGSFILANTAAIAACVRWGFNKTLEYALMQKEVQALSAEVAKQKKDLDAAHLKIRNLQKN